MKRVRRENTSLERAVRSYLHRDGLRFRLHEKSLPGSPDIVFPKYRCVVFVHGCFWHGHHCAHGSIQSKSNVEFWAEKLAKNRMRDGRKEQALRDLGWSVLTIWECEVADSARLRELSHQIRSSRPRPQED